MQEEKNIQAFLKVSNISEVSAGAKVSRPTLVKMKNGDFNVHYRAVASVSEFMDNLFDNKSR